MSLPASWSPRELLSARSIASLTLALLASASMWFYVNRILIPYQIGDAVQHDRPRGNLSDLYPRWLGSRALLIEHRDPYSPEVTCEIQAGYYGRVLDHARAGDPQDQQAFAYPAYVAFLLAPTVQLPFITVQRAFNLFLWVISGAAVWLWFRAVKWNSSPIAMLLFVILTLGSIPAVQGIKLQQLSLLVGALLAAGAALLVSGYLVPSGILLAFSTIKPQLAWVLAVWLMLWCLRDWRRRQRLAWSFGVTMLLLVGGAELLLKGWIGRFWIAVRDYQQYTHNTSVLGWLLTPAIGNIAAIVLVVFVAFLCWPYLAAPSESAELGLAIALIVGLTVLIVPMFAPYNQVLLLPALIVLAREARTLWNSGRLSRMFLVITAAVLFWPWVASVALMCLSFVLPAPTVQSAWKLPFVTTFTLPVLVFGLLVLYAFKSRQPLIPPRTSAS